MADAEQTIQDQLREQQDVNRLQLLPPLEYNLMNNDQTNEYILWYRQTAEGNELRQKYRNNTPKGTVAGNITEEVACRLKELVMKSFGPYVQQKWSSDGKQPPQPASYFLFHKRFTRFEALIVRLPVPPMDKVQSLVFNQQEVSQIYAQGLPTVITAVGSKELHFHEVGRLRKIKFENSWIVSTEENYDYMHGAIAEFKEINTTEVWFRRAKNGMPQFIFCPADYAKLPPLPLPLSQPGQPEAVLELSRLEAMPALLPERFRAEHKDGFYQWLVATDKFHREDEDPENLELKSLLLHWCSNGVHISDLKISLVTRLYEEYVRDRWRMPHKQLPFNRYVYLFGSGLRCTDDLWIWLPQELMQQANSLILNTTELNQLAISKILPITISIGIDRLKNCRKQGMLENFGTNYRISFSDELYRKVFCQLRETQQFEAWFTRIEGIPNFIIIPRAKKAMKSQ